MNRSAISKEQQALRHRATSLILEGDTAAAKALADQKLEATPGDAFWLYVLGHIARRQGDFVEAVSLLQRSIDEDAQSPHTFDELGMTQRTIGHLADALRAFQQAILVDASYIPPYLHLAGLFHDMGRTEDARLCLLHAREIEPDNAAIHKRLGRSFHQAGELAEAEKSFGEALELDSQDDETQLLKATLMPEFTTSDAEREAWRDRYRDGLKSFELNSPSSRIQWRSAPQASICPIMVAMTENCRNNWHAFTQLPVRLCSSMRHIATSRRLDKATGRFALASYLTSCEGTPLPNYGAR